MFKLSEMTKEEKIGVLITVVYIVFMLGDALDTISGPYRNTTRRIFTALSDLTISLIIPIIGWGVYYIFFKKK